MKQKPANFVNGWNLFNEFVDDEGDVYCRGKWIGNIHKGYVVKNKKDMDKKRIGSNLNKPRKKTKTEKLENKIKTNCELNTSVYRTDLGSYDFDTKDFKGDQETKDKKGEFLRRLVSNFGNRSKSCSQAGIPISTLYDRYLKKSHNWYDEKFVKSLELVDEILLDFAEEQLMNLINKNDKTAIMFFLKTKGAKRGYIEQTNTNVVFDKSLDINIEVIPPKALPKQDEQNKLEINEIKKIDKE